MIRRLSFGVTFLIVLGTYHIEAASFKLNNTPLSELPEKIPESSDSLSFKYSAGFQTRHIWRGSLTCDTWNIQPSFNISRKNFLIGTWAAYTVDNSYSEVDLYVSYTLGNFTVALLDYFCPNSSMQFNRLFDFNQRTTQHTLDVNLSFNGTSKIPIQIMASTLIYGDDLNPVTNKNYFSSYIEANYTWTRTLQQQFEFFVGITPFEGYYAKSFKVVNTGFCVNQTILISESLKIPTFCKFLINPYAESAYLVFGLTLEI
jgi:hypothetical protein